MSNKKDFPDFPIDCRVRIKKNCSFGGHEGVVTGYDDVWIDVRLDCGKTDGWRPVAIERIDDPKQNLERRFKPGTPVMVNSPSFKERYGSIKSVVADEDRVFVVFDDEDTQRSFNTDYLTPVGDFKFKQDEFVRINGNHEGYGNYTGKVIARFRDKERRKYTVEFKYYGETGSIIFNESDLCPTQGPRQYFIPYYVQGEPVKFNGTRYTITKEARHEDDLYRGKDEFGHIASFKSYQLMTVLKVSMEVDVEVYPDVRNPSLRRWKRGKIIKYDPLKGRKRSYEVDLGTRRVFTHPGKMYLKGERTTSRIVNNQETGMSLKFKIGDKVEAEVSLDHMWRTGTIRDIDYPATDNLPYLVEFDGGEPADWFGEIQVRETAAKEEKPTPKAESRFNVGDKVRIIENEPFNSSFFKGDLCTIVNTKDRDLYQNFCLRHGLNGLSYVVRRDKDNLTQWINDEALELVVEEETPTAEPELEFAIGDRVETLLYPAVDGRWGNGTVMDVYDNFASKPRYEIRTDDGHVVLRYPDRVKEIREESNDTAEPVTYPNPGDRVYIVKGIHDGEFATVQRVTQNLDNTGSLVWVIRDGNDHEEGFSNFDIAPLLYGTKKYQVVDKPKVNYKSFKCGDPIQYKNMRSTNPWVDGTLLGFFLGSCGVCVVIKPSDPGATFTDRVLACASLRKPPVEEETPAKPELEFATGDRVETLLFPAVDNVWGKGTVINIHKDTPKPYYEIQTDEGVHNFVLRYPDRVRKIQEESNDTAEPDWSNDPQKHNLACCQTAEVGDRVMILSGLYTKYLATVRVFNDNQATVYVDIDNGPRHYPYPKSVLKLVNKRQSTTAEPEKKQEEKEMKNLIPDPSKEGRFVLLGTGHHFNGEETTHILLDGEPDQGGKIIGYGSLFYSNEVWASHRVLDLPDNLGDRILRMSYDDLISVNQRLSNQRKNQPACDYRRPGYHPCTNTTPFGQQHCHEHFGMARQNERLEEERKVRREERRARRAATAPRRRKIRCVLYAIILAAGLAYASVDFDTGSPRSWVKSTAQSAGQFLKDLGQDK